MILQSIDTWKNFLALTHWKNLIKNITPKECGCGLVYEIENPLNRPNESFAIADMRELAFSEPHYHQETEIYFVLDGEGLLVVGYQEHHINKGSIITIPSNIAHFVIPHGDLFIAVVNIPAFREENYHPINHDNSVVQYSKSQFERLVTQRVKR